MRFHDIFYSIMSKIASYAGRRSMRGKCPIRSFSGPYFPAFGLNTEIYGVNLNLRIQSEYRKIRTRKNSVSGPFSHWQKIYSFTGVLRCSLSKAFSKLTSCERRLTKVSLQNVKKYLLLFYLFLFMNFFIYVCNYLLIDLFIHLVTCLYFVHFFYFFVI